MKDKQHHLGTGLALAAILTSIVGSQAAAAETASDAQWSSVVNRGIDYLALRGHTSEGSFSSHAGIGVTALATTAMLQNGRTARDPVVAKSLRYLEQWVRPDGGIHQEDSLYRNYETSVAVLCFSAANSDGRYDTLIRRADARLKGMQWDESEDIDVSDCNYGGAGYGKHERPDLSNTSFLIDALKACGNGPQDEAIQKALVFVSRCQNLETEHNTTSFAPKIGDGGFYYTCAAGGQSKVGTTAAGGLQSYASMTYAGFKSMVYAGLEPDDPRVAAAMAWIERNYDLTSNPGLGSAGLYYYYHVFAKALDAAGTPMLKDADGVSHDWRKELVAELARRQQTNGSWINDNARWMEGDPNLVTAYALLALSYCRPATK